jgi:ATP-dependent DNA helicase RecG
VRALRDNGRIQPLPAMKVSKITLSDGAGDVAVVEVLPSDLTPVRYDGRVHIRVGPRRAIASEQDERILTERRTARARTFDAQPCAGAALDDLALDLFTDYRFRAIAQRSSPKTSGPSSGSSRACAFTT